VSALTDLSINTRSRCSEGGFGLWLGENSDIVNGKMSTF
jgi:hypothetical protein